MSNWRLGWFSTRDGLPIPLFPYAAVTFLTLSGSLTTSVRAELPASGPIVPELQALEHAMTNFMGPRTFKAGTLALMKDSRLVFRNGYGWRDQDLTTVIHPDNLFRLASVSKPITGTAIRRLINSGLISANTKVYSFLGIAPAGGVLGDSRITNITVQHLLDHAGGWDRSVGPVFDPVFGTIQIATELGLNHPAAASNVISWMFAKPLQFAPGSNSVYSNFGYGILGRVVEKASGKSYINYLRQDVFGSFGITNIIQSRSRPDDLHPLEIWYDGVALQRSAVDFPANKLARFVDGGGYYESYDAFGGLSASALDLCRYMLRYFVSSGQRPSSGNWNWGYIFYGSLPGTTTVINQQFSQTSTSTNGLEFAALFNKRTDGSPVDENDLIRNEVANAAGSITSWPTNGGGKIEWNIAATNINEGAANVTVRLIRTGTSTRAVKVSYATYSRSADTSDYLPRSGIVSFASGELSKNISVPILEDILVEPTEEFYLELISASGGAWLGDRLTAVVRIVDNDSVTGFAGPVITSQPDSRTVAPGDSVTLTVAATGTAPVGYQWRLNGTNIPGATGTDLVIASAQRANAGDYTVLVSNPGGIAETERANLLVLSSGAVVASGLRREVYRNIPGGSYAELMASPKFPDAPDATSIVNSFEVSVDSDNNYGVRLSGFVLPPATGNYRFYLCSDDQSALWLSTDDHPAHLVMIAHEPEWNGSRQFSNGVNQGSRGTPPSNISAPTFLESGRRYFVTALMKEGTGGDNLAVAWQTPGGAAPANGAAAIPGANLAYFNLAPVITSHPQDQTIQLSEQANFSVSTLGTTPLRYQWRRNGLNISGATNRTLTILNVQSNHLGDYTVVVQNSWGSATSRVAALMLPDAPSAPQFTSLLGFLANGTFRTHVVGATGMNVRVDSSTNLASWQTLRTISNSAGSLLFTDTNAPARERTYYRAVASP